MEKICSHCNTSNPQEAKFCRACGKKFEDEHEEKVKKKPSKSRKTPIILGILAAAILVLIHFFEIPIRYNLHFGYTEWLSISKITHTACWSLLAVCAVCFIFTSVRNSKKENV